MLNSGELQITSRLRQLTGWAALFLVMLGILSGLGTFLILTGLTPIKPNDEITSGLLLVNGALVVMMGLMIGGQLLFLLLERRKGTAGAGLHIRLISLFSIVAIVPAIVVAVFASVTLNRGLDAWFSERTRSIVDSAIVVAEAYLQNAADDARNDTLNISNDLSQQLTMYTNDRASFVRRVARQAALRSLAAVYVFDTATKRIDVNVTANSKTQFIPPPPELIAKADKGELVLIPPGQGGNVVRALIKIPGYKSQYLYVYRLLQQDVILQLQKTREAKLEYDRMQTQRTGVQVTFALMYTLVAFVFLLAAIWLGMWFSDRLVAPIVRLLGASRQVAQGNFNAKVDTLEGPGDLINLSRSFNLMTDQIRFHRDQLVETNYQLDDRRRFTEAMLAGVSAGVIGIDPDYRISLVNRSALNLLKATEGDLLTQPIDEVFPEFKTLFTLAQSRPSGFAEGQVDLNVEGRDASFVVRITTEGSDDAEHGYVLTFDDITDLVSAQRNSAWADIARRIAHEIKNPLTPIQLSAERLKRKYSKEIKTDVHVFEQCTDTIIRQVGDIGRMVDEFSSFARMPKAVPEMNSLAGLVRDATVLQRVSNSDLDIVIQPNAEEVVFPFDRRQITQAVTNLVKNAVEAVEGRGGDAALPRGNIVVSYGLKGDLPFIAVTDNGIGLPKENRQRLAEPYMTTREKGTGLGLAIVKRVMEEHGGRLTFEDAEQGTGACISLIFAPMLATSLVKEKSA
jgi:two-component system, NtrC family, nitrogen regulation sensor histidine kinase NtrY